MKGPRAPSDFCYQSSLLLRFSWELRLGVGGLRLWPRRLDAGTTAAAGSRVGAANADRNDGNGSLHTRRLSSVPASLRRSSDTAATQHQFGLEPDTLADCVVVGDKREGNERLGACVVLTDSRADINGVLKRLLDVRKASFLTMDRAVAGESARRTPSARDHRRARGVSPTSLSFVQAGS